MKYFFVYPPLIMNFSPIIGIPQLVSILENNNVKSKIFDLNSDFFSNYINKDFFEKFITKNNYKLSDEFLSEFPKDFQDIICKNKYTNSVLEGKISKFTENIDFCNYILKNKKYFYNQILSHYAISIISDIVDITLHNERVLIEKFLPGFLSFFSNNKRQEHSLDVGLFLKYVLSHANPFYEYIQSAANKIVEEEPDCIGISINLYSQFFTGLLLGYLIKKKNKKIHINIGGSVFSTSYNEFTNLSELIGVFFDTITYGNGDSTVLEIIEYIKGEKNIEDIHNIIYFDKNKNTLKVNKRDNGLKISDWPVPSFSGIDKKLFLSPELVLPIQSSVSCYWGKCKFCVASRDRKYQTKTAEQIISEIEILIKKYNTKYFYFWDNAISPTFLKVFSDLLLKRKIKIIYSIYARFEKEFDTELLKKLRKSGCIKINWGIDSVSKRMISFIDKGIELDNVKKILKKSKKANISNTVSIILGYPTETYDDLNENKHFFIKEKNNIDVVLIAPEVLFLEGSIFTKDIEKYQSLILTNLSERIKIADEIKHYYESKSEYCNFIAAHNLLYEDYYSKPYNKIKLKIYSIMMKNQFVFRLFINMYKKKFNNGLL